MRIAAANVSFEERLYPRVKRSVPASIPLVVNAEESFYIIVDDFFKLVCSAAGKVLSREGGDLCGHGKRGVVAGTQGRGMAQQASAIRLPALFPWIDPFFQRSKLLRYPITPPAVQPQVERGQDDQRQEGCLQLPCRVCRTVDELSMAFWRRR